MRTISNLRPSLPAIAAAFIVLTALPRILALEVPFQPLNANLARLIQTLESMGKPLPPKTLEAYQQAHRNEDAEGLQRAMDRITSFFVEINPEVRVKVRKQQGPILLQQGGFTPVIVKVSNQSTSTEILRLVSPQAGPVYAGMSELSAFRMQRQAKNETAYRESDADRFLAVAMYQQPPMTERLSGLEVEYAIALLYARDAGTFEATIGFDLSQGNQDLGFRGEVAALIRVRKGVSVDLIVKDEDGQPSTGKFIFKGPDGQVYPPQAKRLAPDFYFQEQVYRHSGTQVTLPPGPIKVHFSRGPEYRVLEREVIIPDQENHRLEFELERWIKPSDYGFYSGDHHIHGAGCAHYTMPTQGASPSDMFLQVKGEGLNVGCILTWGPCFDFQRQFFRETVDALSEAHTVIKYDLEISGFGSAALGHVCLLNLEDQSYPNSNGTKTDGWPSWTSPVLRWAKEQGGVTGYAHSASGLQINPQSSARRLLRDYDQDKDRTLSATESEAALLPAPFTTMDRNQDKALSQAELEAQLDLAADRLPNYAIPDMNSVGAMEICVSVAAGLCDFISAMDTARIPEWNMFYHILNCGFPLKVSGETDFPCMSGSRVGQGRVYVQLGPIETLSFPEWCRGLADGKSYVSDGFAHALKFQVHGIAPGFGNILLDKPQTLTINATVAFADETPRSVAHGQILPPGGKRFVGDTVTFHGPPVSSTVQGGTRTVEIVMNGLPVARKTIPADGRTHDLNFELPVTKSSWIALRQFPQLHTNPVNVLINQKPIRTNPRSARWCQETIKQLWQSRHSQIHPSEKVAARRAFDRAIKTYRAIEAEAERMARER